MSTNPIEVAVANYTPTFYAVVSLIVMQAFYLAATVVRKGPEWLDRWTARRKQEAEEEAEERRQEKTDIAALKSEVSELSKRLDRMSHALTFLIPAATTTINALEAVEPGHAAISQGRELIRMAVAALGDNDPLSPALEKLASYPGVPMPPKRHAAAE